LNFRAISLCKKQGPFHPWSFWWGLKANIQRLTCLNPVNLRSFSFREGKIDIKRIRSSISLQNKVSVKES
jgi:hypothetical protein